MGSDFTFEGYNDKPKPCQEKLKDRKCSGVVRPTWNANVGKCDRCGAHVPWTALQYVDTVT